MGSLTTAWERSCSSTCRTLALTSRRDSGDATGGTHPRPSCGAIPVARRTESRHVTGRADRIRHGGPGRIGVLSRCATLWHAEGIDSSDLHVPRRRCVRRRRQRRDRHDDRRHDGGGDGTTGHGAAGHRTTGHRPASDRAADHRAGSDVRGDRSGGRVPDGRPRHRVRVHERSRPARGARRRVVERRVRQQVGRPTRHTSVRHGSCLAGLLDVAGTRARQAGGPTWTVIGPDGERGQRLPTPTHRVAPTSCSRPPPRTTARRRSSRRRH